MLSVMKNKEESWKSQYFPDTILTENVVSFLENKENVIDIDEGTFIHDKELYIRANKTQQLLYNNSIHF